MPDSTGSGAPGTVSSVSDPQTFVLQVPASAESEFSVADVRSRLQMVYRMVRERWWAGAFAALVLGLPLGFVLLNRPVDEVARTSVLVQSNLDDVLANGQSAHGEDLEARVKNQLTMLSSRPFATRVATTFTDDEALALQQPYLAPEQAPSREFLAGLVGGLVKVERERGRALFVISAAHREPAMAWLLAGRFSAEFKVVLQEEDRVAGEAATTILRRQADGLSNEIRELADKRREYRMEHNLITVEENQGIIAERLRTINSALSNLRVERVRFETQLAQAEHDLKKSPTPFENPVLSSYGNLQTLRVELDRLRNEKVGLAVDLGSNHPKMQESARNVTAMEELIASNFRVALQDLYGKLDLTRTSEKQMSDELTGAFNQSLDLDKLAGGFRRMTEELTAKEQALATLLQQIERTAMVANRPTEGFVTIDPPYLTASSSLRRIYIGAGVGFVALGAFFLVPVALYLWSERLSGSMDIEGMFRKEVLGVIPRFSKVKEEDRPHIVRDNVELAFVENFLSLVAQFELSSKTSYPKRILVTSTVPGEGKSMNASNLAATFTRYGRKTVLIDCDFRRPVQHRIHRIEHDEGFLAWAARGFPLTDDLLRPGGPLGLTLLPDGTSLIPAGGVDVQPGHVLVAKPVGELFARLAAAFEVVIIDSPPAGVFQDALMLARYCAESLVVVREKSAHTSQLKKMLADLDKTAAPTVGLVLNVSSLQSVHPSLGGRYGYGKYGYGKNGYDANYSYKSEPYASGRADKPKPRTPPATESVPKAAAASVAVNGVHKGPAAQSRVVVKS